MDRRRRERVTSFVLLPLVLAAVAIITYFTFRTTLRLDQLRKQAVVEATLGLATEKANRLDRNIVDQDNAIMAVADPQKLPEIGDHWLPTARRETPTVRAIVVLDETGSVLSLVSRASASFREEDSFRRLLVQRMVTDMELAKQPPDELRHLHRTYSGQSYLVSYWQREWEGRRYVIVAWHDIGRIVRESLPTLYGEAASGGQNRLNVVDEEGRLIFGPPLRTGEFTVGVRFPTTLYNWRVQVSPASGEAIASSVQSRRTLELSMVGLSAVVIVAGVVTILVAAEKERRTNALKSEFVANVSHELKTPLALVRMFAEMLQSGRVANEQKRDEYVGIILRESERLTALIENVLDFARVERGKGSLEFQEGDVGDAVARAVEIHRYRAEREGVALRIELGPDLPKLDMDERALALGLSNLVDNALKYAADGKEIVVSAEARGREVVILVKDRGPGVAADDRTKIFERFVRGDPRLRGQVRGSGIGLALVKHIAKSHGGRAWVEPRLDPVSGAEIGSAFGVAIPVRRASARDGAGGSRGRAT